MTKTKSDLTETLEVVLAFDYDNFHTKSRFAPVQLKARHTAHTAHPMSYSHCSDSWLWHPIPPNLQATTCLLNTSRPPQYHDCLPSAVLSALPFPVPSVVLLYRPIFRARPPSVNRKRTEGGPSALCDLLLSLFPRCDPRYASVIVSGKSLAEHDSTGLE